MAAKAKKAEAPKEEPKYIMPAVEMGDSVLWHDSHASAPTGMALVTMVGSDNITVAVVAEGCHNCIVKTGVRHKDHPDKKLIEQTDQGVWSHRPGWLKILERLDFLEAVASDETEPKGTDPSQ